MPSGGNPRGRKNWGNGNTRSGYGSRGSGGSNYMNSSSQQYYQNYSSYQPTTADSYENYDYGSDYVGDYRYSPYAAMERAVPQYYEPRPAVDHTQARPHNTPASSLPQRVHGLTSHAPLLQPSTVVVPTVSTVAPKDNNSGDHVESSVVHPPAFDSKRNEMIPEDVPPVPTYQRVNMQPGASLQPNAIYEVSTPNSSAVSRAHPSEAQYHSYPRQAIVSQQQPHAVSVSQPYYSSPDGYQTGYAPNWRPEQPVTFTHSQSMYPGAVPPQYHQVPFTPQGYYPEPDINRGYHRGHPPPQGGGEYGSNATGYPPSYHSYY